jgi:hypothetical protein
MSSGPGARAPRRVLALKTSSASSTLVTRRFHGKFAFAWERGRPARSRSMTQNIRTIDISDAVLRLSYVARHGFWLAFWAVAIALYFALVVALEWGLAQAKVPEAIAEPIVVFVPALVVAALFFAVRAIARAQRFAFPRLFKFDTWDRPWAITGVDAPKLFAALGAHARGRARWTYLLQPRRPILAAVLMIGAVVAAAATAWALIALYSANEETRAALKLGLKLPFLRELIAGVIAIVPALLFYAALSWLATDASNIVAREAGEYFVLLRAFARDEFEVREPHVTAFGVRHEETRLEDVVARVVKRAVPLVAIGNPEESLPALGANRAYFSDAEWQQKLNAWLAAAKGAVVLMGGGTFVDWEVARLEALALDERCIFFFPDEGAVGENLM